MATVTKTSIALFPTPADRLNFLAWVDAELKPGVDYILAHRKGCPVRDQQGRSCQACGAKATLSKAGAERVCIHLGLVPQFARDQDTWEMLGKKAGMLCYVCTLHRGSARGPVMGEGRGARTVEQDGGDANMSIKMGGKCLAGRTPVLVKSRKGVLRTDIFRLWSLYTRSEAPALWLPGTDGDWRRVERMEPRPAGPVRRVEFQSGLVVSATPEHRWLTTRGLVETASLEVGDVIETRRLPMDDGGADAAIGWVVGLFLAEGCAGLERDDVKFSLHADEDRLAERLLTFAQRMGFSATDTPKVGTQGRTVGMWGPGPVGLMKHYVNGEDSYSKRLSVNAWHQGPAFLSEVLAGYLEGDGSPLEREGRQPRWMLGFTGRNRELRDDLFALAAMFGWRCKLAPGRATCQSGTFSTYKGWMTSVEPRYNDIPLGQVVSLESDVQVTYEIEVDGDHLFCLANGLVTHNSAQVDATLRTAGLSERFTQDVGENEPVVRAEGRHLLAHGASGVPTGAAPLPAPRAQEPVRAVQIEDGPPTPRVSPSEVTGTLQTPGDGTPGATTSGSGAEVRSEPSVSTGLDSSARGTPTTFPTGPAVPPGLPPLTHPVEFTLPNGQVVKGQCTAGVTAETVSALIARTSAGAPLQAKAAAYLAEHGLPALRHLNEDQGRALLGLLTDEGPRIPRRANGGGELDWPTAHAELVRVANILSQPTAEDRAAGTPAPTISVKEIEALAAAVFQVDSVQQIKPFELMRVAAEIETMGLKDRPALALALGRVGQGT